MAEYIEREALMKFPIRLDHYDKKNGNEHFVLGIESVLEYAENLPAADVVERKRGEWWIEDDGFGCELMTCSVCKASFYDGDNDTVDSPHNFCPNCGCDMRGESDA